MRSYPCTTNQTTNETMNQPTNETMKRIFGSMFAKARCALPKCLLHKGLASSGTSARARTLCGFERFRSPFCRPLRGPQTWQQPVAVGFVAHLFIEAERFFLPALQVADAMLVAGMGRG